MPFVRLAFNREQGLRLLSIGELALRSRYSVQGEIPWHGAVIDQKFRKSGFVCQA
jgi:hypothetical protein